MQLTIGALTLLTNAFFVGGEFALISVRRSQIEPRAQEGNKRARMALWGLQYLPAMMATAQLGITASSLVLGAVAELAIAHLLEPAFDAVHLPEGLVHPVAFVLALLLYVYAVVGWAFFADDDPEHYGSIGRAVLTLFLLMTLDGLGDAVRGGLEISRWSILYHASYVLLSSFVLVNVLVGVVLTSLEEAREMEEREAGPPAAPDDPDRAVLHAPIAKARQALDELEECLSGSPASRPRGAEERAPTPLP
ncbi:CNNM domain-containing protein [Streptomyces sp. NRRL WC-3618]|uniref:CNNM domain-containing protein n=1 Tax=Streptomyces sp. NRRL WC-3618 TaxID=1519490 RepID=UPI00099BB8E4|nr:CNNM domain-containing protein [Streptomyces sp. NRRL WC-3618]